MRLRLIFAVFILFGQALAWGGEPIDFVFDIDGVLAWPKALATTDSPNKVIYADGAPFVIADAASELLLSLSKIPGARISFFSKGMEARNVALLKGILLANGQSAFDLAQGRVFSRQHTRNSLKDLSVIEGLKLSRAVLIENIATNSPPEQRRNLLLLKSNKDYFRGPGYLTENYPAFLKNMKEGNAQKAGRSLKYFMQTRHQLVWTRGLIDLAFEESSRTGRPLLDVLGELQANNTLSDIDLIRRGRRLLHQENANFQLTTLLPRNVSDAACDNIYGKLRVPKF